MAKVLLGATIIGIRGSVGGNTFSANKSGPYVTAKTPRPANRSVRATEVQSFLTGLSRLWSTLNSTQKGLWNTFAAAAAQDQTDSLGQTYSLSGFQWFLKVNMWRFRLGIGTTITVPALPAPVAPTTTAFILTTITVPGSRTRITYPSGTHAGKHLVITGALATTKGRLGPPKSRRPFIWSTTPGLTSTDVADEWNAYFGPPIIGQRGWIGVYSQTTQGYRGPPKEKSGLCST